MRSPSRSSATAIGNARASSIVSRLDGISLQRVALCDRAAIKTLLLDPEQEQFAGDVDVVFDGLQKSRNPQFEHPLAIVAADKTVGFFILRERLALPLWAS